MAKFKVKNKEYQLSVKVKLSFWEKIDKQQLDMFAKKAIRGFLKIRQAKKNVVEYYGPIAISLYDRLSKKEINKYDFLFMMEQILVALDKVSINELSLNHIVLDAKKIYINETTKEIQFIYLPLQEVKQEANVQDFIEYVVYLCKPMQENDMDYISRFIYHIRGLKEFDAKEIETFIASEDINVVKTIKRHNTGKSGIITDRALDSTEDNNVEATGLLDDNEATGLLNEEFDDEATGLLREENGGAKLIRCSTGEEIIINIPVFRIGKEPFNSDYILEGNDKVSRKHVNIVCRGFRYYVVDLGSKNGTYVNDRKILPQQEVEILDGYRLKLADEEFEFKV